MMMGPLSGIFYFIRALWMLLSNPSLIGLALIPSLITLALSLVSVWLCGSYGSMIIPDLMTSLGMTLDETSWLSWALEGGVWMIGLVLSVFLTPWLVILFGFPLCEPLSAKADTILGGDEIPTSFLAGFISGLKVSIGLVILGIAGNVLLVCLGFIPGLGLITAPLGLLVWTPLILCFDLCDAKFNRMQLTFKERFRTLFGRFFSTISVGLVAGVLIMPPFLNLLGLPVAVLMGTLYARSLELDSSR
jgi:uncharacterized protein involved in cysteine biosynthesis